LDHLREISGPDLPNLLLRYDMDGARGLLDSLGDLGGGDDVGFGLEVFEFLFDLLVRLEGFVDGFLRKGIVAWVEQEEKE